MKNTDWEEAEFLTEPYIITSHKGWTPVVNYKTSAGETKVFYIGPFSLYKGLKPLWEQNGQKFTGMKFSFKKAYDKRSAPYEVKYDPLHAV